MRRWLTLLLLVMLPLQFSWSVAAAYCQHESSPEVRHVGHHEHEHQAAPDEADKAASQDVSKLTGDNDCGYCHLSAARPLQVLALDIPTLTGPVVMDGPAHVLPTRDPDRLERPKWSLA